MKHSKQQPKTLEDQYDSALERLYLKEWPDAVPKHENESCCSHCSMTCSSEWDSKSRKMFKKVFPSYIFYFLVFTGTLPARRKACHYIIKIFWILFSCYYIFMMSIGFILLVVYINCYNNPSCLATNQAYDMTSILASLSAAISNLAMVILSHTYLRERIQSHEMRTLIASISPGRAGRPTSYW